MIRITIGDDQALLCESLANILDSREGFSVVSKGANGIEVFHQCKKHSPDIVLIDIMMPLMDGIETLRQIKKYNEEIKVIVFTTFDNEENIINSIMSGADGYVTKELSPEQLFLTIECVNSGLKVISPSAIEILKKKSERNILDKEGNDYNFTEEEKNIIIGIANGRNNRDIAKELCVAEGTLKNKLSRIYKKTGIDDRVSLAVFAVENGLVT